MSFPAKHSTLPATAVSPRHAVLEEAIAIALRHVADGLGGFCARLSLRLADVAPSSARVAAAAQGGEGQQALLAVITNTLERALREELSCLAPPPRGASQPLALVPYDEMDQRVTLAAIARPFDAAHADALAILGARMAHLFGRPSLRCNPFRPEVFIAALQKAWQEFDGEPGAAAVLALVQPHWFHDLGGIYAAINLALERHGVLPGPASRRVPQGMRHDGRREAQLASQLQAFFAQAGERGERGEPAVRADGATAASSPRLLQWLASLPQGSATGAVPLASIKGAAPQGVLSRADEGTIDLVGAVFDCVSADSAISPESRELLQLLQVPLLKAALVDRDFFFQAGHPARRLLELLSRMGWERTLRGAGRRDDRQWQAMRRSVGLAAQADDETAAAFTQAVHELEAALNAEEAEAAAALAEPVAAALKQEKTVIARRAARAAVALRVGSGEVVAVVEAFLENKWTDVLTVAYSIDDARPGAVRHATQAMDELLWSVRPKLGADERRTLVAKLPGLLATLNRWLDVIKWRDAERLRFFAELAECHASIVRAPLDIPAERRVELSVQAAQLAAQRRLATAGGATPAAPPEDQLAGLARGTWFDFTEEGVSRKVKLAWISPQRTLYIFSNGAREEAFSLPAEALVARLQAGTATALHAEGVVVRALSRALAVNDAAMVTAAACA